MRISVSDEGTYSVFEVTPKGVIVVESGGCPVDRILQGLEWSDDAEVLMDRIREKWAHGYDGDPNGIRVMAVRRGGLVD